MWWYTFKKPICQKKWNDFLPQSWWLNCSDGNSTKAVQKADPFARFIPMLSFKYSVVFISAPYVQTCMMDAPNKHDFFLAIVDVDSFIWGHISCFFFYSPESVCCQSVSIFMYTTIWKCREWSNNFNQQTHKDARWLLSLLLNISLQILSLYKPFKNPQALLCKSNKV